MTRSRPWLLLALVAAACGNASAGRTGDRDRLRVLVQPFVSHAPLLIADAEGYFAEQGIDVEFVRLSEPSAALPLLIDGSLDVLTGGPTAAILNAMARGLPVRAVADKGYFRAGSCSRTGMVIRKDLLDGAGMGRPAVRRVSIEKSPQQVYLVERMLASVGLRPEDMELKYVLHAPEMDALSDGTLDAALAGEPWLTLNIERGAVVQWIRAEDVLPDVQFSFVYFGPSLMSGNPDIGRRFLVAYLKAVRKFEEGKTSANLELLARVTGDSPDMIARMCWPAFHLDGHIDFSGVRDFNEWAVRRGLVEQTVSEVVFWDPTFLQAANRTVADPPAAKQEK